MGRPSAGFVRLVVALGILLGILAGLLSSPGRTAAADETVNRAETPAVTMKVTAGLDGWVRDGGWLPLSVELTNQGADLDAQVVVDAGVEPATYGPGSSPYRTEYTAEARLPRLSHKLIHLAIPYGGAAPEVGVKLVSGGRTVLEQNVSPSLLESDQLAVGILANQSPQTLQMLGGLSIGSGGRRGVVPIWLNAATFPGRPELFGCLDVVLLDDFPSADLSEGQRRALRDWVFEGGHLLAIGGGGWQQTLSPLPGGLLPVVVSGDAPTSAATSLARFARLTTGPSGRIIASQAERRDGSTLAASGSTPLVVVVDRGLGRVVYLAVDPTVDPLVSWPGTSELWATTLAESLPQDDALLVPRAAPTNSRAQLLSGLSSQLASVAAVEPPSLSTLALLLGAYILLIGLGSYVALGWLRRRELGWITVPVMALGFAVGTYAVAQRSRGHAVILSTVSILRLDSSGRGTALSVIGSFAPGDADYRFSINSPAYPFRLAVPSYGGGGGAPGSNAPVGMAVREGEQSQDISLTGAAPWSVRAVAMQHLVDHTGQIEADLRPDGQHLRGTITNRTRFTLDDCLLIAGNSFARLGRLPEGGSRSVDVDLSANGAETLKYPSGLFQAYAPLPFPNPAASANPSVAPLRPSPDLLRKQPVFLTWLQSASTIGGRGQTPLSFVGWSDQPLLTASENGQLRPAASLDLITQPLTLDLSAAYDVGPGLIPGRILDTGGSPLQVIGANGFRLDGRGITLEFLAPSPGHLTSLGFHVATFANGLGSEVPFTAEIYDWPNGRWDSLDSSRVKVVKPLLAVASGSGTAETGTASTRIARVPAAAPLPTPPPVPPGARLLVTSSVAAGAQLGGQYTIDLGGLDLSPFVDPDGTVRLRLSDPRGSLSVSSVSLLARGSP